MCYSMKKSVLSLCAAIIAAVAVAISCRTANAAAEPLSESCIVTDSLQSRLLGCTQKFNLYLPQGYTPAKNYPVIYLLHGLWGSYPDWDSKGRVKVAADIIMAEGSCLPAVIVMPNAGDPDVHHYQSGYFNVEGWPYEDFFFKELIPAVEKRYHSGGSKARRAVMGLSMGGGGTIVYAQRHTDIFSSAYGMSSWLDNNHRTPHTYEIPDSKLKLTDLAVQEHSALDFVRNADDATVAKLKEVHWFLDCGDDDYLLLQSLELHKLYREKGIKSELRVRDGAHNWEYWHTALYTALPFASRYFGR